jgi:hypothetical protein
VAALYLRGQHGGLNPMPAEFCYRACGLTIGSDAPIAGLRLIPSDGQCDLRVSMQGQTRSTVTRPEESSIWYVSAERDETNAPLLTIWKGHDGYLLWYSEGAECLVDHRGSRVHVRWDAPLTEADAATYLLGPVLAFILRLRGTVPLHASAVAIDDRGVLFVGEAGAGKSTTAAAFASLGYPVLSDDIVPIADSGGRMLAYPSHPRLSVWNDSADMLFGPENALPLHSPSYSKRYLDILDAGYRFQSSPVPIDAIYVLGDRAVARQSPSTTPMRPRSALLALVTNTYCNYLLDAVMREREFDVLSELVRRVPVSELAFGGDLEQLWSSCQVLARHAQRGTSGQPS